MGAKTALLAFADGDIAPALLGATRPGRAETGELVRQLFPGYAVEPAGETTLGDNGVYPPDDVTYATALAGADLFSDRRLVSDRPSELPGHVREAGAGRRIIMHGMHSAVDWLAFAIWEDGTLVRSLSLSPDGGIQENLGEPCDFEAPFWAGEHPVRPMPGGRPGRDPYPLPFHALELGEAALRALFGFVLEGYPHPGDIDPFAVPMLGFRVTDPTGQEQAARDAAYAEFLRKAGPPRRLRMGPDGTMQEVDLSGSL